jgi:hypothetical protein
MAKYIKINPVVIEAITFNELVEYGKENGGNIVNGMPWSFEYNSCPVTHENDECYLILSNYTSHRFTPLDVLITDADGKVYPCRIDKFEKVYVDTSLLKLDTSPMPIDEEVVLRISECKTSDLWY